MELKRNPFLEILKVLGQVQGMNYTGAIDSDGNPVDRGLKSDGEITPRNEFGRQLADGFNFSMLGDILILKYHGETTLKALHGMGLKKYEADIVDVMRSNMKFVQTEYQKIAGSALSLKEVGEPLVQFEYINKQRSFVLGNMKFQIKNLSKMVETDDEAEKMFHFDSWFKRDQD
jgi:hypothetical protein